MSRAWRAGLDRRIAALERLRDTLDGCIGCGCLSLDTCALFNPDDAVAAGGPGPRILMGDPAPEM
jgi:MerR family redox-sensitive transcriptional activator SoxR